MDPNASQNGNVFQIDFESVKNQLSKLVLWDCPKKSGIVLGGLLFIEIVLMSMSFLSIIGYSGLALLIFFFGYRVFLRVTGKEDSYEILKKLDTQLSLSQEECDKFSRKFGKKLETMINYLRELFLMKNIGDSLKFAGFLYFLTYVGATMNFLTLCFLATIFSFTLPKIYQMKRKEIDQLLGVAKGHLKELSNKTFDKFNELKKSKLKGMTGDKTE